MSQSLTEIIQQIEARRHLMTPEELAEYHALLLPTRSEIEQDWKSWYGEIFRDDPKGNFIDALDSVETDDRHHSEALSWHWDARAALVKGERPPNDWFAYFPIWSRGHMKTGCSRRMIIADACQLLSANKPGYTLYIGGTKEKVRKTAESIHKLLESPKIKYYYPELCKFRRNKRGVISGWRLDYIHTFSGHIFEFASIEQGMAGANVEDMRITFMCLDDIDNREDSVVISEGKFKLLTNEILPMGQASETLVFFAQNLISRYSVMYQIQNQSRRVLTDRKPTEPIPAVRDMVTEPQTRFGIVRDMIVSGKCTWKGWSRRTAQDELNRMGLAAFKKECLHDCDESREGLALQNWNDTVHVITWSQFEKKFGCRFIPRQWNKYNAHDWARTKTKFHANVDLSIAVSSQNSALPGAYFVFNPYSFKPGCSPEDVAQRILTGITPTLRLNDGAVTTWEALFQSILKRTELESHRLSLTELITARRNTFAEILPKYVGPILQAQNYLVFRGSHEQNKTGALEIYQRVFGIPFQPCVDEGEVLTVNGWIPIQDISVGDYVYSVDLQGVMSLKPVTSTQQHWYEGDLVKVHSRGLYQSFTPDHQIVFRNDNKGECKEKWRLLPWNEYKSKTVDIIRHPLKYESDCDWECPFDCVDPSDFIAFVGLWLAEGSLDKRSFSVRVTQCTPHKQQAVRELLDRLPWKFTLWNNGDFAVSDAPLHRYLSRFGKAHDKFVPREILRGATVAQLSTLFEWMVFGDGHRDSTGVISYYTVSPYLANDVCEIGVKLGWKVAQTDRPCNCVPTNLAHRPAYVIYLSKSKFASTKVTRVEGGARLNVSTEHYEGPVYDLTVADNHTFVIRQKGRVWVSGNCNPGADGGVNFLNLAQQVDYSLAHPFKEGLKGYTRFFLIVNDDKEEYQSVLSPDDLVDDVLFRFQMRNWRWRDPYLTSKGEMEGELLKLNDDFGNALMFLFHDSLLQAASLNREEQVEAAIAPGFTREELQQRSDISSVQKDLNEWFARGLAERAIGKREKEYDDYGNEVRSRNRRWGSFADIPIELRER